MRILILNGPNLGTLGRRQPDLYGTATLMEIVEACEARAAALGASVDHLQSNHEGTLIDRLERLDYDAIVCNFGAYSHTSYALHDALLASARPAVEVHISDISRREPWRRRSVTAAATRHQIVGRGWPGYLEAIEWLVEHAGDPSPAG